MMRYDELFISKIVSSSCFTVSALSQIPFMISEVNPFNVMATVVGVVGAASQLVGIPEVYKNRKKAKMIMNSSEYAECVELYKEYVSDIARMFEELGFDSNLISCIAYRFCLETGVFSKNLSYVYRTYRDERDYFPDLCGARIATGAACCRHSSVLLTDIINEMGGVAANIPVLLDPNSLVYADHLITGVVHDEKKYLFDSTVSIDKVFPCGIFTFGDKNGKRSKKVSIIGDKIQYEMTNLIFSKENEKYRETLRCYPSGDLDVDDLMELYVDTFVDCVARVPDFMIFHNDEKPKIKRLAQLSEYVCPHGVEE